MCGTNDKKQQKSCCVQSLDQICVAHEVQSFENDMKPVSDECFDAKNKPDTTTACSIFVAQVQCNLARKLVV